jgi:hypothetical protein
MERDFIYVSLSSVAAERHKGQGCGAAARPSSGRKYARPRIPCSPLLGRRRAPSGAGPAACPSERPKDEMTPTPRLLQAVLGGAAGTE